MAAGPVGQFRGRIFTPQVYSQARSRISDVFYRVEQRRDVIIPDAIRLFLTEAIIESLILRHAEWTQTYNANPSRDTAAGDIAQQIDQALSELLSNADAEPRMPNGKPLVTFIGILGYIHEHWCHIFPFCR
jgi:hypothetical protein